MAGSATAPSAAVRQQAEDACTTMQAAVAALKDSQDASCPAASRPQLQAASQALRMEVAKLGLLYNQAGSPSEAEAAPLIDGFQSAACTLCMLYTGLAAAPGGGPTLRASLHSTATSVVEACVALVRGAILNGAREAQLMMLSGFALEMLEVAGRAPLDSRTAIGRAITQVLKQLADAQKELEEAIQEAEEAAAAADEEGGSQEAAAAGNGQENGGSGSGSDAGSDAGFGFEAEAFDTEQLEVARRSKGLLTAVAALVKAVVRQLLAEREGLAPDAVEGWESMLYHIKALAPVCDDLAAAVYPPQDAEELASAAEALATSCDLLKEECPPPGEAAAAGDGSGNSEAAAAAERALQAALEGVQAAHGQLAAALGGAGAAAEGAEEA